MLFIDSQMVELRKPSVFKQIVKAIRNDNFTEMKNIIENERINTTALNKNGAESMKQFSEKIWPFMIDAYFREPDAIESFELLTYLLHSQPYDMNDMTNFVKKYFSQSEYSMRRLMTSRYEPFGSDII